MLEPPTPPDDTLRLLECWLPLAQQLNEAHGWEADAQTLERLILTAAPALKTAATATDARVALWQTYQRLT